MRSELRNYELSLLKEVSESSNGESEGCQRKKIKTDSTGLEPSLSKSMETANDYPLQITTTCDNSFDIEQMEADAALALALQMKNVDSTYASLFTVDAYSYEDQELAANEELVRDQVI